MSSILAYTCFYENSRGERVYFDRAPYVLQSSGIFDYEWELKTWQSASKDGGRCVSRRRPVQEKRIVLDVFAPTQAQFASAINRLADVIDTDVINRTPGKLWIGAQYALCYIYASYKTLERDWWEFATVSLSVQMENPCWITERRFSLLACADEEDENAKVYPLAYPYRYGSGSLASVISNDSISDAPMKIVFYGYAGNPEISIGGNTYGINAVIETGEYAVIDGQTREVYKIASDGTRINLFDRRTKQSDVFAPLASGSHTVEYSGAYGVDITIYQQRSEPLWT